MQRYWEKDWNGKKKLIAYCKKFASRIVRAYENDEAWEPQEVKEGLRLVEMLETTLSNQIKRHKQKQEEAEVCKEMLPSQKKKDKHRRSRSKWSMSISSPSSL